MYAVDPAQTQAAPWLLFQSPKVLNIDLSISSYVGGIWSTHDMSEYGYVARELKVPMEARDVRCLLELKSWLVGSCPVSARDWTQVFCKVSQASIFETISPTA